MRFATLMLRALGLAASIALPLWNIPLIIKIARRRSAKDISLAWTLGVFGCFVLMLPSGLISPDPVFRVFCIANVVLFSGVVIQVLRYR